MSDCDHKSFCATDDDYYVMCEDCEGLFDAADVASHLSQRLAAAEKVVEAAESWSYAVDAGFAAKARPDVSRAMFLHALREYRCGVDGGDTCYEGAYDTEGS